jgi:hypothetical protein
MTGSNPAARPSRGPCTINNHLHCNALLRSDPGTHRNPKEVSALRNCAVFQGCGNFFWNSSAKERTTRSLSLTARFRAWVRLVEAELSLSLGKRFRAKMALARTPDTFHVGTQGVHRADGT